MVANKLAFVTGAGSGIGREICRVLARQGAKVIGTDRSLKSVQETIASLSGSEHLALNVEVSNEQNIKEAFKQVISKYATPPTIVVNSAGITRDQFILNLTNQEFDEVLDVNLKGTFYIIKTAVKEMIDADVNKGASIINISSITGNLGNIGQANYAASKAGVIALTKTAALEFGQFGVRVNTVLPGFIETPMTETVPENVKRIFLKKIALQRTGKPEEVAEVVTFLASNKSSYVNGTSIEVTGGIY
ncbi:unnamed protein product [Xylocopa violacea]|uniref:Ketoreductase domain-containing protein n=1 Tax=Xylocopa violacea TaxID=135666 RepID=A0ABP1P5I4_XYLVO